MTDPQPNGDSIEPADPGVDTGLAVQAPEPPEHPAPTFEIIGAHMRKRAAAPVMIFDLAVEDLSERPVFTIALAIQIAIEPAQRRYDPETRQRLVELLGEAGRIGAPTTTMPWAQIDVLVQPFTGHTTVQVPVVCNYDLEIAATKYFTAVPEGEVPLVFHFNGSVYHQAPDGRLQIVQISWDTSTNYRMPIAAWQEMIDAHYPFRGWVPAASDTIERLREFKVAEGLPTYDAALERLLDR